MVWGCSVTFRTVMLKPVNSTYFPSPFNKIPHPLAVEGSLILKKHLQAQTTWVHDFDALDGGKMFGVLVYRDDQNQIAYLFAYSGMLAGEWEQPGFVSPVFDVAERKVFLPRGEKALDDYTAQIETLLSATEFVELEASFKFLMGEKLRALVELKEKHAIQKTIRRKNRLDANELTPGEQKKILLAASLESQRDRREKRDITALWDKKILAVKMQLNIFLEKIEKLKQARGDLSRRLHEQVFDGYQLKNSLDEIVAMNALFTEAMPPGGAGDCAAPKLIQYANLNGIKPLAIAEFWWGVSPASGIRHHGEFYPACRGKCHPILPFMMQGLPVESQEILGDNIMDSDEPKPVYEDADIVIVNKPCGLLSIPGKEVKDSVLTRLQKRYPNASGPLLVHRLDLATSGLLLAAKNKETHKALQEQFIKRQIQKRYVALLNVTTESQVENDKGVINLPLRVDINDRPRQLVCYSHGKSAFTEWEVISREKDKVRVSFYPVTGRTHQLRLHAAHKNGLNAPIIGDTLYGFPAERLFLHAAYLSFIHPGSGERIEVESPVPF